MKIVNVRLIEVVEEGKNPHIKSENEFGVRVRIELELGDKKDKDAFTDMAKQLREGKVRAELAYDYTDGYNAVVDALLVFKKK